MPEIGQRISNAALVACVAVAALMAALAIGYERARIKVYQEQASSWARLLAAMHDTNTGLLEVKSGENKIFYASPEARTIFGYEGETMDGLLLSKVMPMTFAPEHEKRMLLAMDKSRSGDLQRKVLPLECNGLRKDGKEVRLIIRIYIARDSVFALVNLESESKYLPMTAIPEPKP